MKTKVHLFSGEKVRFWRLKRKMTESDLANMLGTQTNFVQNIEIGNDTRISSICRVATALAVHPRDFFVTKEIDNPKDFLSAKKYKEKINAK